MFDLMPYIFGVGKRNAKIEGVITCTS